MTHIERKERRKRMARVVADGCTIAKAAESFCVSLATVSAACIENRVAPAERPAAARRRAIADAVASGMTVPEVCEKFNCHRETARMSCATHGVPWPRQQQHCGRGTVLVVADLLVGPPASFAEIARRNGVSPQFVSLCAKTLKEAGVAL